MKKFHFQIETLLKLNKSKEKMAKLELANAQQKLAREEIMFKKYIKQAMINHENESDDNKCLQRNYHSNVIKFIPVKKLVEDIVQSKKRIQQCQTEVEQKQKELENIIKKRKALAQLKEKRYQKYLNSLNIKEQREFDDIEQSRYNLKSA